MEESSPRGLWGWIKAHAQWIAGGAIALIVAWYLIRRPKATANAPTTVSFPSQPSGGGGGDIAPTLPAVPTFAQSIDPSAVNPILSTIWSQFGFEQVTNEAAFATGWTTTMSDLLNLPIGVVNSAWNAIQLNPQQYVSQLGVVDSATAAANIANLINGLLRQYNINPSAFDNISLSGINPINHPLVPPLAPPKALAPGSAQTSDNAINAVPTAPAAYISAINVRGR